MVDEVEYVDGSPDVVQLPKRFLGLVLTGVGAQLTHDRSLGHVLLRKRRHDALDVRPFLDDQGVAGLAHWLDEAAGMVGGVAEIDQAGDPLVEIAVARRELVRAHSLSVVSATSKAAAEPRIGAEQKISV